jgi:GMP synthase (glutamine-hydrolysing)
VRPDDETPVLLAIVHQADSGPGHLARAARAAGWSVEEWLAPDQPAPGRDPGAYDAVLILGGAMNVKDADGLAYLRLELELIKDWAAADVPQFGVCLGAQLLAEALGGGVARSPRPEIGWFDVDLEPAAAGDPVLGALPPRFVAYQWHAYAFGVPPGASLLAASEACPQAFRRGRAWGVQFHPEVTEPILASWFESGEDDPDAAGFSADAARAEVPSRLPQWTALGARMFDGFLAAAREPAAAPTAARP